MADHLLGEQDWTTPLVREVCRVLASVITTDVPLGSALALLGRAFAEAAVAVERDPVTSEQPSRHAGAPVASGAASVFRREGEYWTLAFEGTVVRLKDAKGFSYIAHLLDQPACEFHVASLATLGEEPTTAGHGRGLDGGDLGAILDPQATTAYKRRLAELREELEDATRAADLGRAACAREEIAQLTYALTAAYGLGGRARKTGDPAERVRKAVTNQIRRCVERIQAEHPELGRHLTNTLRTGVFCRYTPERRIEWQCSRSATAPRAVGHHRPSSQRGGFASTSAPVSGESHS